MPDWLITCSCGWTRECSSEWAAKSVVKLHPRISPTDMPHIVIVTEHGDGEGAGTQPELPLADME